MELDSVYVEIDLDAIAGNIAAVREKAKVPVMGIIKADAYGHGAVPVAKALKELCAFFGVSSMAEAMELRHSGIENPILVLGHTPVTAYPQAVRLGIRPAIFHWEDALALSRAAVEAGAEVPFHFAVDTGMSRIGFQVSEENADLCARIAQLPGLKAEGLFSHFATADCADLSRARKQAERFDTFDRWLKERDVSIPIRHLNNSAGLMNFETHYDMVRSGIITYGLYPSDEVSPDLLALKPAMSFHSRVSHVKVLPSGREVSYGGTYVTKADTTIATLPVGYADGYRRSLSNKFHVLIQGQKAPILGRVCMDQMMVDVTGIPGVAVGTPVTLIGKDGAETITMEAIGRAAGSFNYEFACGISRRVPRYYYQDGHRIKEVHYLLDFE